MIGYGNSLGVYILNPYIYGSTSFTNTKSLLFDGVDEGCTLSTQLYNGQTNYSWSYWVKFTGVLVGGNYGVDWAQSGSKYNGFVLLNNDLIMYLQSSTNATAKVTCTGNITQNTWHNIIWTYDGSGATNADKLKIYIDGVNKTLTFSGTIASALTSNALTTHRLPNHSSLAGINRMNGNVDEVAHWSGTTLTATNATDIYNSGAPNDLTSLSPSHWWRFGDGSGDSSTTIYDQIGAVDLTGVNLEAGDIVSDVPS